MKKKKTYQSPNDVLNVLFGLMRQLVLWSCHVVGLPHHQVVVVVEVMVVGHGIGPSVVAGPPRHLMVVVVVVEAMAPVGCHRGISHRGIISR